MISMRWIPSIVYGFIVAGAACAPQPVDQPAPAPTLGTLVDLSHPYDGQTLFWPTAERFALKSVADGVTPGGYYYAANWFSMEEHGGTHIDAPRHFADGRWTVDEITNLDRLPATGATVIALPMMIARGSSAPLRAVGILPSAP
jgi:kynurenine formamidase